MKPASISVACLISLWAMPIAALAAEDDFFGGFGDKGKIIIYASAAKKVVAPMRFGTDPKAAKGKYLEIPDSPPGGEKLKTGHAFIDFEVKEKGDYCLHLRAWWPDACGNSMYVSVDDSKKKVWIEDATVKHWHWVKARRKTFLLDKGKHTIKVMNREDGARFDQILLTTDKEYVPQGTEE